MLVRHHCGDLAARSASSVHFQVRMLSGMLSLIVEIPSFDGIAGAIEG
jgi:hypothetical protein